MIVFLEKFLPTFTTELCTHLWQVSVCEQCYDFLHSKWNRFHLPSFTKWKHSWLTAIRDFRLQSWEADTALTWQFPFCADTGKGQEPVPLPSPWTGRRKRGSKEPFYGFYLTYTLFDITNTFYQNELMDLNNITDDISSIYFLL